MARPPRSSARAGPSLSPPPEAPVLLPTGVGEPKTLSSGPLASYFGAAFFSGGDRLLLLAAEPGRQRRSYIQDLGGGPQSAARGLTGGRECGLTGNPVAPDG